MKHFKAAFASIAVAALFTGCSSDDSANYQSASAHHAGAADQGLPADASTAQTQEQQVTNIYTPTTHEGQPTVSSTEYTPPAPADTGSYSTVDYTVVEGDSLWKIARRHNTNVSRIKEANNLTSDNIRPGQVIKVPVPQ
ncbi:LysM peptidoglycan-binding domain-containing protein [Kamptonema cortianum]|uniref:LysM peptidoglycan-binding domain-containing protein n=1 Tax=Geitlerinema calcuttense NRMC-F 0142 TaxID=2922238 RepID=A0ABT7M222_9CYAN|nr:MULTISPECIES: LysM peptidoglycan-binding domain-containing protein [Cyanophyceae]MDK3161817.1 LysM peptidoglycan-binding domain-containing protein [Kamptonema cortianum]MDL5054388.1 LysM peptidoglycan-binding domain-containing protein [Oscillatoria laete-virens NRMC-F 0139]MDL5057887.1 LysM peptidoglycan-binding domain-containing protein [Geitlerinema calcuttense NRMC-F 0142]